jgi:long-chain acyl-CoA synthetase
MERITARQSEEQQHASAAALLQAGCRVGDRVAIMANNSAALISVAIGALRAGIVPVMINPNLLPGEQQVILDDCQPTLTLNDISIRALIDEGAGLPTVAIADAPLARPMHYTSGTTGKPKGVWSGILEPPQAEELLGEERAEWNFSRSDVNLVVSPLYHSAPLRFATGTLMAGGDVVVLDKFSPELASNAIRTHMISTAFMAPAHLHRLFSDNSVNASDLSSFRLLAHAGAPCPVAVKQRAIELFPSDSVWEFYGSTEGQFTACSTDDWSQNPGTIGRARTGRTLAIAENNVIWCDVPSYARFTYWNDAEKTAAAWRGNAFSVFDIGRLDANGFLYLDGRRDDLLISGGVNVYPLEIEIALAECPGVLDVAVFGRADEQWGDRVCAAIVPTSDAPGNQLNARELQRFAERVLAPYKRPKEYVFVPELPRTPTGKIRRSRLAEDLGLS